MFISILIECSLDHFLTTYFFQETKSFILYTLMKEIENNKFTNESVAEN